MDAFNEVFKKLAEKMSLPAFFKGNTLVFNNLFLAILTVVLLIALLLVIFLVPGKKKKTAKDAAKNAEESAVTEDATEEPAEEPEATDAAPAEESAPVEEAAPAEEPIPEQPKAEEPAPAEQPAEDEPAPAEDEPAPAEDEVVPVEEEAVVEDAEAEPAAEEPKAEEKDASEEEIVATKATEPAGKNGGKYEIVKRNGSFYFLLKANNGQLLLESSAYTTEQGAKKAVDTFKKAVEVGEFNIDEDKNGNFKFILRASSRSQMLYHGETYSTRQSAESAIQSVKNFAFRAVVKRVEEDDFDDGTVGAAFVETKPLKESDHKLGGKYEIVERLGSFYFLLKANNGQLLLESPAFTTEQGAKNGIESFKKAADSGVYSVDEDKNGNFRFILRAGPRAQMRYFGESYSTRQSAENSVNSVRSFAQKAVLKQQ